MKVSNLTAQALLAQSYDVITFPDGKTPVTTKGTPSADSRARATQSRRDVQRILDGAARRVLVEEAAKDFHDPESAVGLLFVTQDRASAERPRGLDTNFPHPKHIPPSKGKR